MRYLTSTQETQAAARGSSPTLLAVLTQSAPGLSRTFRWTSAARGSTQYGVILSGTTYYNDIASITSFPFTIIPRGGIAESSTGRIEIVQADENGTLWTDTNLDAGPLDGANIAFYLLFWTETATSDDLILLTESSVTGVAFDANLIDMNWRAIDSTKYANWPKEKFQLSDYPFALHETYGTVKPVIFGDMTGEIFNVTSGGCCGGHRHVLAPGIDGMRQRYFVRDIGVADDQETIVDLGGILCTFVDPTIENEYIQIDDNLIYAWVPPHRVNSSTAATVENPEYCRSDDLNEYAVIPPTKALRVDFPGLPTSMGVYGHDDPGISAEDCTIYVIHSSSSGTGSGDIEIYHHGVSQSLSTAIAPTTTLATTSIEAGNKITDMEDTSGLSVDITNSDASKSIYIHRIIIRFYVRSTEVLAAWREQKVARSQRGFIESAVAASDDYMDGGYIDAPGTVARTAPATNPADQLETIYRNKNFGLALRAATYTDPSVDLTARISPSDTTIPIGNGEAASFSRGDAVLCDYEVMRVSREPNLVSNSGFEDGLTGWSNWASSSTREVTTDKAHSGTYSYHHVAAGDNAGIEKDITSLVEMGETYTISAWVYPVSVTSVRLMFHYQVDSGTRFWPQKRPTGTGAWERISFTKTIPAGTTLNKCRIYLGGEGEAYFDDVQVVRGSESLAYQSDAELTVTRGTYWTRPTWHVSGSDLYVVNTNGEVNVGAFRGAAGMMRFETGATLVTDGTFETYGGNSGADWTEYDPDDKGSIAATYGANKKTLRYGIGVTRSTTGGAAPAAKQTLTTVAGTWYRISAWVKCAAADTAGIGIDSYAVTFSGDGTWQYHEYDFEAADTSEELRLYGPISTEGTVYYDDVAVKELTEWSWDYAITEERDARDWVNEATQDNGGGLRITTDEYGRIGAYALDRYRMPWLRPTWDTSDILADEQGPIIRAEQTDADSVYTGVTVRYGYDAVRDRYLGATYIVTELESTGETVVSDALGNITVTDTSNIFPTDRWDSEIGCTLVTSGTDYKTCTYSDGVNTCDLAFQTNGVIAGDWCVNYFPDYSIASLSTISSVDGEKVLTLEDPMWYQASGWIFEDNEISCFPYLFLAGGLTFIPAVVGVGNEDPAVFTRISATVFDQYHFGNYIKDAADPGDIVYRLISDSDDGTGTRDQHHYLRDDRERWSMARVAQYGKANNLTIEAPLIQDRATAVELRNKLFDHHQRGYIWSVATDLSKIAYEIGDQVVLSHEIVPGGTMTCEIISQNIDVARGRIDWTLREIHQQ